MYLKKEMEKYSLMQFSTPEITGFLFFFFLKIPEVNSIEAPFMEEPKMFKRRKNATLQ